MAGKKGSKKTTKKKEVTKKEVVKEGIKKEGDVVQQRTDKIVKFVKRNNFKIMVVAVFLAAIFLVYHFGYGDVVEVGNTVKLNFVGKLEDGSVFDSSEGKGPLEFEIGSGIVIAGFDEGIRGMKVGDKKTITVPSEKAYGNYDESKIGEFPKEKIPDIEKVGVGDKLFLTGPDGGVVFAIIKEIEDEVVVLDLNHPLTGKTLIFEVEILEIN